MWINNKDLVLRNAKFEDAKTLADWWNDGSIMAHAGFPLGVFTSEEKIKSQMEEYTEDHFVIIIEFKGKPIGEMNYEKVADKTVDIGIKICENDLREHGLGRVILSMFINYCFELGNETISLTTNLKNKRAQHVYEKLGFKVDKITYGEWEDQLGCPQNTVYYSLVKKDFNDFTDYNYQI